MTDHERIFGPNWPLDARVYIDGLEAVISGQRQRIRELEAIIAKGNVRPATVRPPLVIAGDSPEEANT